MSTPTHRAPVLAAPSPHASRDRCPARAAAPWRRWVATAALALVALILPTRALAAGAVFTVRIDPALTPPPPVSGRLIVSVIAAGAKLGREAQPLDAPFWDDPQPLFGMDVVNWDPTKPITLDDSADAFPIKPSVLPPGNYRVQARFVRARLTSDWHDTPGNFYTRDVATFVASDAGAPANVELVLNAQTAAPTPNLAPRVELFEVSSLLLTEFHQSPVTLRAAVVVPAAAATAAPGMQFPAIYEVTGFGGNVAAIAGEHATRKRPSSGPDAQAARLLSDHAFWIVLDAESPNGHTLFVDSANNGPWMQALTTELIPALEAKYPLKKAATARLLRGHSSGGWSVLWLALNAPETFAGGTWATSPDPVDFRRLQMVDIYAQPSVFKDKDARDIPSFRKGASPTMTMQQEVAGEHILGPGSTSGQQWASWMAAWGPRNEQKKIVPLFDSVTGDINPQVVGYYKRFDISQLLRAQPEKHLPVFRDRIRIVVGTLDNFYLNEAVALLRDTVADLAKSRDDFKNRDAWKGSIRLVANADHGSILASPPVRAFPREMLEALHDHGHLPDGVTLPKAK